MDNREIDKLIAEKVMGFDGVFHEIKLPDGSILFDDECPAYSTDISAAWEILNKFKHWYLSYDDTSVTYLCEIITNTSEKMFADTAPMAICLAALRATGVDVGV